MKLRWKVAVGMIVAIATLLYVKWDDKRGTFMLPKHTDATVRSTSSRIIVTTNSGSVIIPNYGHGVDIVKRDDSVTYSPIAHGKSLTPGFSTDLTRVGGGMEIAFYKRFGLLIGSNFYNLRSKQFDPRFYVGLGYRLPWGVVDNISLYTGIDSNKAFTGGVFLRFGGN